MRGIKFKKKAERKTENWEIWHEQYLLALRERKNGPRQKDYSDKIPAIGDVVLIKEEDRKRGSWPIAIIKEFFPGKDGIIRSARVEKRTSIISMH
jgi:hypothetical protein